MEVYKIVTPRGPCYIRAISAQAAAVRAFKVWGVRAFAQAIGQIAPDIGAYGYQRACDRVDTFQNIRGAQVANGDTLRGFYAPSKAKKQRIHNEAMRLLADLGLA